MKTFEDYLQEQHAKQYVETDEIMSDNYNDWLDNLDKQEVIDYAEKWGKKLLKNI